MRATTLVFSALALLISACADDPAPSVTALGVQGALIDGSEDPVEAQAQDEPVSPVEEPQSEPAPGNGEAEEQQPEEQQDMASSDAAEPAPAPDEGEQQESDEALEVTYQDLSLIDYDVDAMLDYMLFPEEYEDEDKDYLMFPDDIKRLDGRELSIVGYMIPGEMDRGNVRDFMLVRDLMGCCFGGAPMPDEWIDVVMEEDVEAEYRPYLPMRVTGVMTLGGDQDEAGFALGIYRLKATRVQLED